MTHLIIPQWPAPANVRACSTTRRDGVSRAPWDSLNLSTHVQDCPEHVSENRQRLITQAALPQPPFWLDQIHSTEVVNVDMSVTQPVCADASYTCIPGEVCAILTADCLPVIFCNDNGTQVAAAHAGWRGLCAGILEKTLATFRCRTDQIHTWLGPAIGPQAFEVGTEVRQLFIRTLPEAHQAFQPYGKGKYLANLPMLAAQRLKRAGVRSVSTAQRCTYTESKAFFSYRRNGLTGRMATLIWLSNSLPAG